MNANLLNLRDLFQKDIRYVVPNILRAFFVILAYTAVLVAAAIWVFQRRDITGARGE